VFPAAAGGGSEERLMLAAVLAGARDAWLSKPPPLDVWDGKGLVEGLIRRLVRRDAIVKPPADDERPRYLHPRGAAWIDVDGARVGSCGPLHPDAVEAFALGESVLALELDLDALDALGRRAPAFTAPPRFPASLRDVAVVVRDEVAAGDLERAVREAAGDLAEQVTLFDRFSGGAIPAGHASLALRVVYRAADRTLTDAEVDARHERVVAQIRSRFGGELRS
jgi:phenylalanyl-tRNA synthetase beta chain